MKYNQPAYFVAGSLDNIAIFTPVLFAAVGAVVVYGITPFNETVFDDMLIPVPAEIVG